MFSSVKNTYLTTRHIEAVFQTKFPQSDFRDYFNVYRILTTAASFTPRERPFLHNYLHSLDKQKKPFGLHL